MSIGARTVVGPHVVIEGHTTIGEDNQFFQFSSIGAAPQDKKWAGEPTRLEVGDRNTIREFCTFNTGTVQDVGVTRLGNDNWISAYVHLAHDCQVGSNTIFSNNAQLAGHVEVGDWAILSGYAGVHQFCKIGAHAFIGMYTSLTQDVPPFVLVSGNPAGARGVNIEGLKRRGFTREQIDAIRAAYKLIYRSGMTLDEAKTAIAAAQAEAGAGDVARQYGAMLDFLGTTTVASSADMTGSSAAGPALAMVAGEVSGDMLAARLIASLRPQLPQARFHGIGGPRMIAQGFESALPIESLAVGRMLEIIPRYRAIKAIQNTLRDRLLAERPAAFIGADYPGFNLGLEMQLKEAGIPTVHLVSPQIWAWRGGRIKKIIKAVSHMLLIFPFEEEIYRKAGVPCTYIGHPLAETIPLQPNQDAARRALGLPLDVRVVTVMPGSRMSELKYLATPFIQAVKLLVARDPDLRFVVPMAGERQRAVL